MTRLVLMLIALCGLVFVRATSATIVPVWSPWWWVWIFSTCGVAACAGWVAHEIFHTCETTQTPNPTHQRVKRDG